MSDPVLKALQDTQRALDSERATSEQLRNRLHAAHIREDQYIQLLREQTKFIEEMGWRPQQEVSDVA